MRTISEVRNHIVKGILIEQNLGDKEVDDILKQWVLEILDSAIYLAQTEKHTKIVVDKIMEKL